MSMASGAFRLLCVAVRTIGKTERYDLNTRNETRIVSRAQRSTVIQFGALGATRFPRDRQNSA